MCSVRGRRSWVGRGGKGETLRITGQLFRDTDADEVTVRKLTRMILVVDHRKNQPELHPSGLLRTLGTVAIFRSCKQRYLFYSKKEEPWRSRGTEKSSKFCQRSEGSRMIKFVALETR